MRIIIAAGIYPPDIGGPATYSQMIAKEFVKRGIEVRTICYSDKKHKDNVIRVLRKHNILIRYWFYFWNLLKLAISCDVIYGQGPLAAGLPAILVSKILRKKFVIKVVGDYAWEQYQNRELRIMKARPPQAYQEYKFEDIEKFQKNKYDFITELRRKIQRKVVRNADKVIVPSEFLKRIVKGWDVNKDKIEVIYNAFIGVKNIKPKKLDGDVIISAGRLEPWKGVDTLMDIFPDLLKENPNFYLIIIGKQTKAYDLKPAVKRLKGKSIKRFKLMGQVPYEELMGYFEASKIFVLNSGYEGLSHIILQAMACGLLVVTTNVGGNPEIIKDGYDGLLIEYNNRKQLKEAILKLWRDKELQKKFIENGKRTLEKFKLETMIEKTLKMLKS